MVVDTLFTSDVVPLGDKRLHTNFVESFSCKKEKIQLQVQSQKRIGMCYDWLALSCALFDAQTLNKHLGQFKMKLLVNFLIVMSSGRQQLT
jgi:hypothetical protein